MHILRERRTVTVKCGGYLWDRHESVEGGIHYNGQEYGCGGLTRQPLWTSHQTMTAVNKRDQKYFEKRYQLALKVCWIPCPECLKVAITVDDYAKGYYCTECEAEWSTKNKLEKARIAKERERAEEG